MSTLLDRLRRVEPASSMPLSGGGRMLCWTASRPRTPGWYWVRLKTEGQCAVIVQIDASQLPVADNEFSDLEFSDRPIRRPIEQHNLRVLAREPTDVLADARHSIRGGDTTMVVRSEAPPELRRGISTWRARQRRRRLRQALPGLLLMLLVWLVVLGLFALWAGWLGA